MNTPEEELSAKRLLPLPLSIVLSIWALVFAVWDGILYFINTYILFETVGWWSFSLLLSPAFYLWIILVSSMWYAPLVMVFFVWTKKSNIKKSSLILMAIIVPLVVTLIFGLRNDFWFPLTYSGDAVYIRLFPFF